MEFVAAVEVAGALFSTLKGIWALCTVIEKYVGSKSQMVRFNNQVNDLESQLQGLRDIRISLRRSGENINLLVGIMNLEQHVWKILTDIDNDVLCSLWQNDKHWLKVSKRQRVRWIGSVNKEAAKFSDRLASCIQVVIGSKISISTMHEPLQYQVRCQARLKFSNTASEAMEEALDRKGRNGARP
ncbi:hypothetical protein LIA77_01769 [Sarocladium implicatum]|nr:hypothetical protein LIA77_01769 [Sarocladium implicatum]